MMLTILQIAKRQKLCDWKTPVFDYFYAESLGLSECEFSDVFSTAHLMGVKALNFFTCMQVGLVVQMLLQWLVCHLVKRIMQLMTVEAFIEHSSEIPVSYVRNYLSHQAHFSLRKLINMYQKRRISQRFVSNASMTLSLC